MKRLAILLAGLAGLGIFLGLGATGSHAATRSSGDPTLTLVVHIVNGGSTTTPADYTLMATSPVFAFAGAGGSPNVTEIAVPSATYQLSASGNADTAGFVPSVWMCIGATSFTDNSVTLSDGDIATCSITTTGPPVTTTTTAAPTTTTVPATTTTVPGATTTLPSSTTLPGATTTVPGATTVPSATTVPGQTTPGGPSTTAPATLITVPPSTPGITAPSTPAPGCPGQDPQCPSSGIGLG